MILHITTPETWQAALQAGFYDNGLQREGFIHCCLEKQLNGVVTRYYSNASDLIVLCIDETQLSSPVKYEPSPVVPDFFPHIYGIINLDAVQTIEPLDRYLAV